MNFETMSNFKQNLENLYSKERLKGYKNLREHSENLNFIGEISPRIAKIEIALRNMLDFALSEANLAWLESTEDEYLVAKIKEIRRKNEDEVPLTHHQILSRLTLGVIVRLIKDNKSQNTLFNLREWDFRDFSEHNRNFFRRKGRKYHLLNITRVNIALSFLVNIRNRAFHWENLRKTIVLDGVKLSRIYVKEQGIVFSVDTDKIELFLTRLADAINVDLLKK